MTIEVKNDQNMIIRILFLLLVLLQPCVYAQTRPHAEKPLRVGIAGLTHGHVHWILRSVKDGIVELAGIAEPNRELAQRLMKQYDINPALLYADLHIMIEKGKPEAVT